MKAIECQRASGKVMGAIFLRELRSVNTAVSLGSCVLFSHYFSLRAEQVERLLSPCWCWMWSSLGFSIYTLEEEIYAECSSLFMEKALPGTNVAAKTRLGWNDSHQKPPEISQFS